MLKVNNLSRNFGNIEAVKNLNFSVSKGNILGFIGPNGAGKTTTMRMLTGYLTPSIGEIFINDKLLSENELDSKRLIGYLPERAPMYADMLTYDFLFFCADIRRIKDKQNRLQEMIELCSLQKIIYRKIGTLSKGYRQRVCFAQSIIHNPQLLILDEPTDGLDPLQKNKMRQIIKDLGKDKAIILSTHILEEIGFLATHVLLLDGGKTIINEDVRTFKDRNISLTATFLELMK